MVSLPFLLVWLCSQPAAKGVAKALGNMAGPNKIWVNCKAYFKKELLVLFNSVYMVILVNVLLSLLKGGEGRFVELFQEGNCSMEFY